MRDRIYTTLIYIFTLCLLFVPITANGQAQDNSHQTLQNIYTSKHPLIVEGLWNFGPFSFLDEDRKPMGIDIDMTKYLLDKLNIPYVIKLKYREDVKEDLRQGKAQLSWDSFTNENQKEFKFCKQSITYLIHAVAYRKNEMPIKNFKELSNADVIICNGSSTQDRIQNAGWGQNAKVYENMRMAMNELNRRNTDYVVWNSLSLKYIKKTCHFDSIEIANIEGMTPSPYKFMGTDSLLLHKIDSVFADEYAKGNLVPIYDKWFYTNKYQFLPKWIFVVSAFICFIFIVVVLYHIIYRIRISKEKNKIRINDGRLALAIKSGKIKMWYFDVKKMRMFRLDKKNVRKRGTDLSDFGHIISDNNFKSMKNKLKLLIDGNKDMVQDIFKTSLYSCDGEMRVYQVVANVIEKDKYGKAVRIIGINKDITEHYERKAKEKQMFLKYKNIFNSAMVAISYIDSNGVYADVNEKWCQFFNIKNKRAFLETHPTVMSMWGENCDFDESEEPFWGIRGCDIPANEESNIREAAPASHNMIENRILPIINNQGKFIGASSSFADITENFESLRSLKNYLAKTKNTTNEIKVYTDNINLILKSCGIRMFWLDKKTFFFKISDEVKKEGQMYNKSLWFTLLSDDSKIKIEKLLQQIRNGLDEGFSITAEVCTEQKKDVHYKFVGTPVRDSKGKVKSFFGLVIDVTELAETQKKLEEKKKEAQNADLLKSAFLKNMSHEIRTPLQAVIGFSELLSEEHDEKEESFFVGEIKRNTNMLLKIVNEILLLSKLDAGMVKPKQEPCDMALLLKSRCDIASTKIKNKNVELICMKNVNETCTVATDSGLITRILDNLIDNAVRFTDTGYIKVNFGYEEGLLMLFVEDTGCGIDNNMQTRIFDRFVKEENNEGGSGLGLSFCKVIAELMGGSIHLDSKKNKGTTVWVRIPCRRIVTENKVII